MVKISGDAGHGYYTSGKRTPDGEREWSFNDKVIRAFEEEIKQYEGVEYKRLDDPTGQTDVPLSTRTNAANAWGSRVHVSFHHNANTSTWGTWGGVETHVYKTQPADSTKLAQLVQPELVKAYGLRDRGIKFTDLHMTRETHMTSILVEGGFMDSTIDIVKLRDNNVLRNAGIGIAKGVAAYLGLKRKSTPVTPDPTPTPPPTTNTSSSIYGVATITADVLNVRSAPSTSATIVGKVRKNEPYKVWAIVDGWYCLGGNQWVWGEFVSYAPPVGVITGDVWLHSTPDFNDSSRVRVLKAGEPYVVWGEVNGMYAIGGYVSKNYMKLT